MIISLLIFSIAYLWLLIETDWLRVRLPMGESPNHSRTPAQWDAYNAHHAKELAKERKEYAERQAENARHNCPICRKHTDMATETITVKSGNSTCHVIGCQDCRDKMSQDIIKSQNGKHREPTIKTTPLPLFIERVRVGSHREKIESVYGKTFNRIVEDCETVYRDCLVPKEWLQAHEHDLDNYEPLIEVTVDNGKALSLDGDYKKGMIQIFMAEYTEKKRAGRKVMTVSKGEEIVNCGGGVYVTA